MSYSSESFLIGKKSKPNPNNILSVQRQASINEISIALMKILNSIRFNIDPSGMLQVTDLELDFVPHSSSGHSDSFHSTLGSALPPAMSSAFPWGSYERECQKI